MKTGIILVYLFLFISSNPCILCSLRGNIPVNRLYTRICGQVINKTPYLSTIPQFSIKNI